CTFFNSAGGLKGFKGSCYEGGIRIPCIVKWPGNVEPGSTTDVPSYFPDWFPTLSKIAQAQLPGGQQLDGIDLGPALHGKPVAPRTEPMIWDFNGYSGLIAIRDGRWKAVRRGVNSNNPKPWELYDLEADRNETTDLASQNVEIVKRLEAAFVDTRTVEPDFPNRLYDKMKN
ncbi:MAG: sulfatase-like hydrolase/transferase, partial [Pirellulaceae bacterium]|nr:sulfatase-like hydrolase/transferase [Pirellulaceae bacterium]